MCRAGRAPGTRQPVSRADSGLRGAGPAGSGTPGVPFVPGRPDMAAGRLEDQAPAGLRLGPAAAASRASSFQNRSMSKVRRLLLAVEEFQGGKKHNFRGSWDVISLCIFKFKSILSSKLH